MPRLNTKSHHTTNIRRDRVPRLHTRDGNLTQQQTFRFCSVRSLL